MSWREVTANVFPRADINPRYLAYCRAHGQDDADAMLESVGHVIRRLMAAPALEVAHD